jgi:hypothetical protein
MQNKNFKTDNKKIKKKLYKKKKFETRNKKMKKKIF